MTESDWLTTTTRPADMLRHVRAKASARKLQLISCGCARLVSSLLTERQLEILSIVERHADGLIDHHEYSLAALESTRSHVQQMVQEGRPSTTTAAVARVMYSMVSSDITVGAERAVLWAVQAARLSLGGDKRREVAQDISSQVCDLFREVIGNPFAERVVVGPGWEQSGGVVAGWMTRVGETARLIAAGVQAEQAFDRLPILADALEDDGCTDAELLAHLRRPGPHARGCWALDVVLGKG
jgi:hypothetical protein